MPLHVLSVYSSCLFLFFFLFFETASPFAAGGTIANKNEEYNQNIEIELASALDFFDKKGIMQPTYHPSKLKRARMCGFRARMATKGGRSVINARRRKGRRKLTQL